MAEYDYLFKFILVGDSGVGKSCFMIRFADDTFIETFICTVGVDFKIRTLELLGKTVKLQIWDTAGSERFRSITTAYYRGADAVIVMYDVSARSSFDGLKTWLDGVKNNTDETIAMMLVGNKCDVSADKRQVPSEDAQKFAEENTMLFFETSAKDSTNVTEAFTVLAKQVLEQKRKMATSDSPEPEVPVTEKLLLQEPNQGGSKCAC
eukprot:m51a1_g11296 putative ras-like gtp-binding protein ypt1 (207) ;mRNA; r:59738-61105